MEKKVSILLVCYIFLTASVSIGGERGILRTEGLINPGGNPAAGYLLINEMRVHIDQKTQLMSHQKTPISLRELKPKTWVYLEAEKDPVRNITRALRIYLLPRYLSPEEMRKLSFRR